MILHFTDIKVVATGGDLSAATARKLEKSVVGLKILDKIVERILSNNPNPSLRVRIGRLVELKFVYGEAGLTEVNEIHGGTLSANVLTLQQGVTTLSEYDIRLVGVRTSDGGEILIDLTKVQFIPETDLAFESGNETYIPAMIKSTYESEISIDNSAA